MRSLAEIRLLAAKNPLSTASIVVVLLVGLQSTCCCSIVVAENNAILSGGIPRALPSTIIQGFRVKKRLHNHQAASQSSGRLAISAHQSNNLAASGRHFGADLKHFPSQLPSSPPSTGFDYRARQTRSALAGNDTGSKSNATTATTEPTTVLVPETPVTTAQSSSTAADDGYDNRVANFINVHLLPKSQILNQTQYDRTEALTKEFAKVYRVIKFAANMADKVPISTSTPPPPAGYPAGAMSRSSISSLAPAERRKSSAGATAGKELLNLLRGQGGKLLVSRLIKKTDWNTLFVKLAKVFLQYFLDLILNDMFGTTGSSSRSFVSSDINLRKSMRNFVRLASGLSE